MTQEDEPFVDFLKEITGFMDARHFLITPVPIALAEAKVGAMQKLGDDIGCLVRYDPFATEPLTGNVFLKFTGSQFVVTEAREKTDKVVGFQKWVMVPIAPGHYFWMFINGKLRVPEGHLHQEQLQRRYLEKSYALGSYEEPKQDGQ